MTGEVAFVVVRPVRIPIISVAFSLGDRRFRGRDLLPASRFCAVALTSEETFGIKSERQRSSAKAICSVES